MRISWEVMNRPDSKAYVCGHCSNSIASAVGYEGRYSDGSHFADMYICHHCGKPTFFAPDGKQVPGVPFGSAVANIAEEGVAALYEEARNATSANAFTAAVMCCRKLLMHIAVDKGADPDESFEHYVEYLADHHYVPPDASRWVDRIRTRGNEANHEIRIMEQADAAELISFCEMLLKVIYEFPARVSEPPAETAKTGE